jgi:glycosyltransferase 2 family protein
LRGILLNLLKIAVSAGLIIFILSRSQLDRIAELLRGANVVVLLLALLFYLAAIAVGNLKWRILLDAQDVRVSFFDLLSYTFAGLFFGNVLPSNVGSDLVRAYDLARHTGYVEQSAVSVLIDRLVGLIAYLALAVVMAVIAALTLSNNADLESIVVAAIAVFGVIMAGFSLLLSRRAMTRMAFVFKFPLLSAFRPMAQRVFVALQIYRHSYRALAQGMVLALAGVGLAATSQWLISQSLHLDISFFYFLLFSPLIAFVLLVPLSVNGIGLKEMAFVFFLGRVGVAREAAFSLSLVLTAIILISSLPGGFVWFRERSMPPIVPEE